MVTENLVAGLQVGSLALCHPQAAEAGKCTKSIAWEFAGCYKGRRHRKTNPTLDCFAGDWRLQTPSGLRAPWLQS